MNDRKRQLTGLARRLAQRLPVPVKSALRQLRQSATKRATADESTMAPLLSVVVVACNAESYLSDCLVSLQSQNLKRLEVLVVDDGSTDDTVTVARAFATVDPRFHVHSRPRLGLTDGVVEGPSTTCA